MAHKSKFIVISGSTYGVGTTTIANYVAVEIAKRGHLTLLVEFKTRTGFSVYMQGGLHEKKRSLAEMMNAPETLNDNTIRSVHSSKLFYTCMNLYDDSLRMQDYTTSNIISIISEAKKYFEYIILDLPADPRESISGTIYTKESIHKPDHQIMVVDEQAVTYKYLNDFNGILQLSDEGTPRPTTFLLNKIESSHYQDYIAPYLNSLPITKPINLVHLPYLSGLTVACNSSKIYETDITDKSKVFFKQIDVICDIIEKDLKSVNVDLKSAMKEEKKVGGSFFQSLFTKSTEEQVKEASDRAIKKRRGRNQKKAEEELEGLEELDDFDEDDYEEIEMKPKKKSSKKKRLTRKKAS